MSEIKSKVWEGEIPVHYLYTYGLAGERFFREIKDRGVFVSTRCESCNITYLPPRIYCERCFASLTHYNDAQAKGTVSTYTICHEGTDGRPLPAPQIIAHVRIDGTDGGLVHRLSGIDIKDLKIGMKVEAVFADRGKRAGGIGDILHFRPV